MVRENWSRAIFQEPLAKSYFNTIKISGQLWTFDVSAHPCWCYLPSLRYICSAFLLLLFPPCVFLPFSLFSPLILIFLPFPLLPHLLFSVPPLSPSSLIQDHPEEWEEPSSTRSCPLHTSTQVRPGYSEHQEQLWARSPRVPTRTAVCRWKVCAKRHGEIWKDDK